MLAVILAVLVALVASAVIIWAKIHGETNLTRHGNRWRTPANRRKDKLRRLQKRARRYADRNDLT